LNQAFSLSQKYLLRWRFDYSDEEKKCGGWLRSGETTELNAWAQKRDGLQRVCVEGKDLHSRRTTVLAEIPAEAFVTVKWKAAVVCPPPGLLKSTKELTLKPTLIGMELVSKDFVTDVLIDGSVNIRELSDEQKKGLRVGR
jgi:hypothetical protein